LQVEYAKLQALYEDLKATKIDEEVAQLLEQQNRHVSEHGQKAAQLAEHYKAEAERQAALAAELGGGVLVEQCAQLQADLMNCQQVG
jgi:nucleotide-binding universal stress UspA family protein